MSGSSIPTSRHALGLIAETEALCERVKPPVEARLARLEATVEIQARKLHQLECERDHARRRAKRGGDTA